MVKAVSIRNAFIMLGLALAGTVLGQSLPDRVLLIPVDDRPATTQYAQLIGDLAGIEVVTPPQNLLGEFTQPGSPKGILNWMESQDLTQYDAVILSADMIAYGGLIASRVDRSSYNLAAQRLHRLWKVRKQAHDVPFYVFSAHMRLAPTALASNAEWRDQLYYLVVARERAKIEPTEANKQAIRAYAKAVPDEELARYDRTRDRNSQIQLDLIRMVRHGAFNHLTIGQDDSFPIGPHQNEAAAMLALSKELGVTQQVEFCAGIDQIASILVSRVVMDSLAWSPTIDIIYSEPAGSDKIAVYESMPLDENLLGQIKTSGAKVGKVQTDYTLFVNTPEPAIREFNLFVENLVEKAESGQPIAVADANLGWSGTADQQLLNALMEDRRINHLLSYAGWNTAGNTIGTTIPAANVYIAAKRFSKDLLHTETAARRFMLHRLVNDYFYHRYVRPDAYRFIDKLQPNERYEITSENYPLVNHQVQRELTEYLKRLFVENVQGRPFYVNGEAYLATEIQDIKIELPWPRAFEVYVDFELVVEGSGSPKQTIGTDKKD